MSREAGKIPEPDAQPRGNASQQKRVDRASKVMLYQGASIGQLGLIFGMDNRTVARKLGLLQPKSTRGGHPIYSIREAAALLVKPVGDIEEHIKKMHHRDLPPMLLKEFWSGQKARLDYEEATGDLWRTDAVIEHVGEAFKQCRTELLLMSDAVEREQQLSDRAREILKGLIDACLAGMRSRLFEAFPEDKLDQDEEDIDFYFDDLTKDDEFFATEDENADDDL